MRALSIFLLVVACTSNSDDAAQPVASPANAAAEPPKVILSREFLIPMAAQKKRELQNRNAFEIRKLQYFAKPGKFDIYEFDIDVLETTDEPITFTPFNGPPIEIISYGLRNSIVPLDRSEIRWRGSLRSPDSASGSRIRLMVSVRAIDTSGIVKRPEPNRDLTRAMYDQQQYTVLANSVERLSERLVHSVRGRFTGPGKSGAIIVLAAIPDVFDLVVVFELDEEKQLAPADDSPVNRAPLSPEMARRHQAFNSYIESVKRELGITPDQE